MILFIIFPPQANRWWLHLYRLITGDWKRSSPEPDQALGGVSGAESYPETAAVSNDPFVTKEYASPDWPNARRLFPDWLWSGLIPEMKSNAISTNGTSGNDAVVAADLEHARGGFCFFVLMGFCRNVPDVGQSFE